MLSQELKLQAAVLQLLSAQKYGVHLKGILFQVSSMKSQRDRPNMMNTTKKQEITGLLFQPTTTKDNFHSSNSCSEVIKARKLG